MPDRLLPGASSRPVADKAKAAIGGGAGVAMIALAMATAGLKPDEHLELTDYYDIAHVPTACYGHTGSDVHVGLQRSKPECDALLNKDVTRERDGVGQCVRALRTLPYQWAASTRLAHNIGVGGFCRSGTASAFRAGAWSKGCNLMLAWDKAHVKGEFVRVRGLSLRRQRERAQCMTDLPR